MDPVTAPVDWWIRPFESVVMQHALLAGLLVVLTTSVVGTWVVLRGMSFLGDALAHGVLPGVAVAFILGVSTTAGALAAAVLMIGALTLLRERSPMAEDVSIGVLFVGFLASAVVILSSGSDRYIGDLNRFLFGSILAIDRVDLARQAAAAAIVLIGVFVFHRSFVTLTFDRQLAQLLGLRPRLAHGVLLILVMVAIVASFEAVGNLLVFAFLVAPPATAALLVKRVPVIMAVSVGLGTIAVVFGLLIAYHYRTAPEATMALAAVVLFLAAVVLGAVRDRSPSGRPAFSGPDPVGHLDDVAELGPLFGLGQRVALDGAGESALGAEAQLLHRHELGRLADPAGQIVVVLQLRPFAGHQPQHHGLVRRYVTERGEVTRTLVVVLEEVGVDVELVEQYLGHRLVAALGEPGAAVVAAAQVNPDGEIVGPAVDRVVDQLGVGPREFVGIVAPFDRAVAHDGVAQVGEVGVVELDVAAAGRVQGVDLGLVGGREIGEEDLEVGVGVDVDSGPAAPEMDHRRRGNARPSGSSRSPTRGYR